MPSVPLPQARRHAGLRRCSWLLLPTWLCCAPLPPVPAGEALEAYIFMGPVYYQKLKHMVGGLRSGGSGGSGALVAWRACLRDAACA